MAVDQGWTRALLPARTELFPVLEMLRGHPYLPRGDQIFRAFEFPFQDVKVLIVGQDPYPTPGHATGLSFSVPADLYPWPPGLRNVLQEYQDDLGYQLPRSGDLTPWAQRGVCLLNRVLTVRPRQPGAHAGIGWEHFTDKAVQALVDRNKPMVSILWGHQAQSLERIVKGYPVIKSAHPSPRTAHRGFFGSRPFTRANYFLAEQGVEPVDWTLPW